MDASDAHMQVLLDKGEWSKVRCLYQQEATDQYAGGNKEASGFLLTQALVYAYLSGDKNAISELEQKLQSMDRL